MTEPITTTEPDDIVDEAPTLADTDTDTDTTVEDTSTDTEPDTFPRQYVEDLRAENARYRTEAKTAEALGKRLHTEIVRATGKLADPTDLPFDADHLDDPDKLAADIDALLESKPHLKARRITGNIGQGESGGANGSVSLLGLMRGTP